MSRAFRRLLQAGAALISGGAALTLGAPGWAIPADVPRVIDESKVVGAWRLVGSEMRTADGKTFPNPVYGSKPNGYLIYDKSHTMCVFLAASDEPSQAPPGFSYGPVRGDSAARQPATYCGRWLLNPAKTAIIHRIEVSMNARMRGDQVRKAWIEGDALTIRSPLPAGLVDYYLQFKRVR